MSVITTPAIVLSAVRFSETSKIVRLATRDLGVQSAIAKGALRPRSRFGASLQLLSEGQAQLLVKERRELHILAAFELIRLPVGLAATLERYACASAMAEVMLRFAPAEPHLESFDVLQTSLVAIEKVSLTELESVGLRALWTLVSSLGFAPSTEFCVRDGAEVASQSSVRFSAQEGGVLCPRCARGQELARLESSDLNDLRGLLQPARPLPALDRRRATAHRRLLVRYVRHHLSEGSALPALEFWERRPWSAA